MLKVHAERLDAAEVLCLEGRLVNGDTESLRSAVQSASRTSDIVLNLENVTMLDAHGLGVLLQLREQTLAKGVHFKIMNVSKRLYRLFELTRLNTVFEMSWDTYSQRLPLAA